MTDDEYRAHLAEVERLVNIDPAPSSLEGARLRMLASLVERYEQSRFPIEQPTAEDLQAFREGEQR